MSETSPVCSKQLPEPVIVKDCRPQTLPSSSQHDLQHFLDFGGGVNPMAYKGYTFSKQGRFQFWKTHHNSTLNSSPHTDNTFKLQSSKPVTTLNQTHRHSSHRPAPPPDHDIYERQQPSSSCCPLIGPITPLFPIASLQEVGTSTILSPNIYIAWRLVLLIFSFVTVAITVFESPRFIPTLSGFALLYSFFSNFLMLTETLQYRLAKNNSSDSSKLNMLHGFVAIVFQGSTLVCLFAIFGSFLVVVYGDTDASVTAANFFQGVTVYLLTTIMVLHLTDICFTPISFMILSTLPLHIILVSLFAVSLRGPPLKQILAGTGIMAVLSLSTGFILHLFARGIMLAVHKNVLRNMGNIGCTNRDTPFDRV